MFNPSFYFNLYDKQQGLADKVSRKPPFLSRMDDRVIASAWGLVAETLEYADLSNLALVSTGHADLAHLIIQRDTRDFSRGLEANQIIVIDERSVWERIEEMEQDCHAGIMALWPCWHYGPAGIIMALAWY